MFIECFQQRAYVWYLYKQRWRSERDKCINYMMTSSNGNIFRVTGPLCGEFTGPGEFPTQRPVTRSFDVFFDVRLNKRLSKQPRGWWFETQSWSLWRHCNVEFAFSHHLDMTYVRNLKESPYVVLLTHWDRDKMAAISQTTFSNAFFKWKYMNSA